MGFEVAMVGNEPNRDERRLLIELSRRLRDLSDD